MLHSASPAYEKGEKERRGHLIFAKSPREKRRLFRLFPRLEDNFGGARAAKEPAGTGGGGEREFAQVSDPVGR